MNAFEIALGNISLTHALGTIKVHYFCIDKYAPDDWILLNDNFQVIVF